MALVTLDAAPGHHSAMGRTPVPGPDGASLVLEGVARRDGQEVAFTLRSPDSVFLACGEYLGDLRKGLVSETNGADLEVTLHPDHLFGRADKPADDPMNRDAPGFDPFAPGRVQDVTLDGPHLGHVGEGHCHVIPL